MKQFILIFSVLIIVSCATDNRVEITAAEALEAFKNIEGEWELQPNGKNVEAWQITNESVIGKGISVKENDSTITELYFVELVNDSLRLQVQPVSESLTMPLNYMLTKATKTNFVFEKPDHNFPKKMTIRLKKEKYEVLLEGEINGMKQQGDLLFKKIN